MEGTHIVPKLAPQDFISNMPDNVLTNILDRLPLQDAVRTGILARNWRFNWAMITQLVFDESFFGYVSEAGNRNNYGRIISRLLLLLHHGDAVTKFVFSIDKYNFSISDVEDINYWIFFLSRKRIKDLTLKNWSSTLVKMPTHFFSCLELKHLTLYNCCFSLPSTFNGFPNLLSLELRVEVGENTEIGEFITRCPLLETLKVDYIIFERIVKLVAIAKLHGPKILSLSLRDPNTDIDFHSYSKTFEFLASLPILQELELNFCGCKFIKRVINKRFGIAFSSLEALKLLNICLDDRIKLTCAFDLISICPNLQILEITASNGCAWPCPPIGYNSTERLQLRSVMFEYSKGSENEVWLLNYILACSPFLKRIVIRPRTEITFSEKSKFNNKVRNLYQASPVVDIHLS